MKKNLRSEDGVALIMAMMCMLLLTALGAALVLTTSSETMISGNYRNSHEAIYAADAALERAMDDVLTVSDWNTLLSGSVQSAFIDGAPSGPRTLPDGSTLDLGLAISMANCNKVAECSDTDMNDPSQPGRPWGPNNPRWQLYAYGNLADMLTSNTINSQYYVIVFVADDPWETDGDPLHDGVDPASNPGSGVIVLRAEAFGPRGSHKVIELTIARTDTTELERGYAGKSGQDEQTGVGQAGVRVLSWREVR